MKQISYGKAVYGKDEIRAVLNTLNKTTQMGDAVKKFEKNCFVISKKIWSNDKFRNIRTNNCCGCFEITKEF